MIVVVVSAIEAAAITMMDPAMVEATMMETATMATVETARPWTGHSQACQRCSCKYNYCLFVHVSPFLSAGRTNFR